MGKADKMRGEWEGDQNRSVKEKEWEEGRSERDGGGNGTAAGPGWRRERDGGGNGTGSAEGTGPWTECEGEGNGSTEKMGESRKQENQKIGRESWEAK